MWTCKESELWKSSFLQSKSTYYCACQKKKSSVLENVLPVKICLQFLSYWKSTWFPVLESLKSSVFPWPSSWSGKSLSKYLNMIKFIHIFLTSTPTPEILQVPVFTLNRQEHPSGQISSPDEVRFLHKHNSREKLSTVFYLLRVVFEKPKMHVLCLVIWNLSISGDNKQFIIWTTSLTISSLFQNKHVFTLARGKRWCHHRFASW